MATQYFCADPERRGAVRAARSPDDTPVLNGIDYLEVGDDQRMLHVHFLHDLPGQPGGFPAAPALGVENVRIVGGERIADLRVETVTSAANVLTVVVDRAGDFSTYRLRIVESSLDDEPPPDFDLLLSEVAFSFKVDCPSDFDCAPAGECDEPEPPTPHIDYLARDFASFRRLMLDRMAVTMPDWRERNPADVGIALVEVLAYAADHVSYYQDAVATEAYLGTARRRSSVRRHARLIDYPMHDGSNARAWVCLEVGAAGDGLTIPARTPILSREGDPRHLLGTARLPEEARRSIVFETLHEVTLAEARNAIELYTWGNSDCCLPRGATDATLVGTLAGLGLREGDVLVLEEVLGAESGLEVDADPGQRHPVRLAAPPTEQLDRLTGERVLRIRWHAADALPFPLCLRHFPDPTRPAGFRSVGVARGNVVLADHGTTVEEELPAVPAGRRYRPTLGNPHVTQAEPYRDLQARRRSAASATAPDPRALRPWVVLRNGVATWQPQRDLINSSRFATDFVVETEDDGSASLRFGDGVLGRSPPPGTVLRAEYRVGNGQQGNVGAGTLTRVVMDGVEASAFSRVWNPLPATGGTDPESTARARLLAPQAFHRQERAVTEADYAAAAQRHPSVHRAAATRRWTGSWYTMFVTVDRKGGLPVDADFERELRDFLERFRMAGYDLEIDAPRFASLDVALTVCVEPGHVRANVKRALLQELGTRTLPGGRRGFFHPDEVSFGDTVFLSQLIARMMEVPGVAWVDTDPAPEKGHRFHRWGRVPAGELEHGRVELGRLEIARLDNDPGAPEHGRLELIMKGGL